jgi:mRNA interferase MazF
MDKDFDAWNVKKKDLEVNCRDILFSEGEVWWCTVGLNIAEESCGKGGTFRRPVIILKKLSRKNFIGIPLSTKKKEGSWFTSISIHTEIQYALLYQIRMFSTYRLQRRLATLDSSDYMQVKEKLSVLLELSHNHQDIIPGSVGNPKSNTSIV